MELTPGAQLRPACAQHSLKPERAMDRTPVHDGPGARQQRCLHACGGCQPDLDRLAVRPKRTPRAAGAHTLVGCQPAS